MKYVFDILQLRCKFTFVCIYYNKKEDAPSNNETTIEHDVE